MTCGATMHSRAKPAHVHECHLPQDHPTEPGHVCRECGYWFVPRVAKTAQQSGNQRGSDAAKWENEDAPAGCVNTAARADRTTLDEKEAG